MFREELPESCPPQSASPMNGVLYRLVGPGPVADADFLSRTALGKRPIPGKECACSSCSMYLDTTPLSKLKDLVKFPALRDKTGVAVVNLSERSGMCDITGDHVDVWMFADFDPKANVREVIEISTL